MASPSSWIRGFSRIVAGSVAERCLFFESMLLQFTSLPTVGSLRTLGCICLSGQMGRHVAWTEGTHNWQIQSLAILVSLWSFQVTCFVRTGFLSPMKVTQLLQRDLSMVKLQSEVKSGIAKTIRNWKWPQERAFLGPSKGEVFQSMRVEPVRVRCKAVDRSQRFCHKSAVLLRDSLFFLHGQGRVEEKVMKEQKQKILMDRSRLHFFAIVLTSSSFFSVFRVQYANM